MIEKPKPPGPRLIREDFLPFEPMSKYRIKKVTDADGTRYYPQEKLLFWWLNFGLDYNIGYKTPEKAKQVIQSSLKTKVEYIYDLDL